MTLPRRIAAHLEELVELCRRHGVRRLEVFGSVLSNALDPEESDLDFLVEFEDLPAGTRADAYFGLREALEALFGRPVDVLVLGAIRNPFFLDSIRDSRTTLYAA